MLYAHVQTNSLGKVLANTNLRHVNEEITLGKPQYDCNRMREPGQESPTFSSLLEP